MKNLSSRRLVLHGALGRGFTLIELLVVIAIIALLTGIVMVNLTGSRAKARDAKRISDLGNIQVALELYYDRCKSYPGSLDPDASCTTSSGSSVELRDFIAEIPKPPAGAGQTSYEYSVFPSSGSTKTGYVLKAKLESTNAVVQDGVSSSFMSGSWSSSLTCSNASGSIDYCVGNK